MKLDIKKIKRIDKQNMFKVLSDFPMQICETIDLSKSIKADKINTKSIRNIIITGLGGSAIGGDLIRSYLSEEISIPVFVNRNYSLPAFANKNTLAILSSYSGNTEETISAFKDARKNNCQIICISSGGEIEKLAKRNKCTFIKVPGGLQPRCALGYSFFTLLMLFVKLKLIKDKSFEINDVIINLEESLKEFSDLTVENNEALVIAGFLKDRLPIIYSSVDKLDVVNLRWRGQISENAKILAYGNLYPEMNHNELVGWNLNKDVLQKIVVIFLIDSEDNSRILHRMEISENILKKYTKDILIIQSECKTRLGRIFDLIYLGDWVSYYLAILNGVNPTPVDAISYLKKELDKVK